MLDIILAIPLIYFIYKGWKRGLVFEAAALAGVALGAYAAVHFSQWVADLIGLTGENTVLIAFFITFVGVLVLAFFLGKCIEGIFKMVKLNSLNKILGALLGMLKCVVAISVLLSYVMMIDFEEKVITPQAKESSVLFNPINKTGNKITHDLKNYVAEKRAEKEA